MVMDVNCEIGLDELVRVHNSG